MGSRQSEMEEGENRVGINVTEFTNLNIFMFGSNIPPLLSCSSY